MSTTPKLGELTTETERDAIHLAVIPLKAAHIMSPGMNVGLDEFGRACGSSHPHVGIIDPFLSKLVPAGEKCWVCLYPDTVTGMKHHWDHPVFRKLEEAYGMREPETTQKDALAEVTKLSEDEYDSETDDFEIWCCGSDAPEPEDEYEDDTWSCCPDDDDEWSCC